MYELREFCEDLASAQNKDFIVGQTFWDELKDVINVLQHPATMMKKIQRQDLTPSDINGLWIELTENLKLIQHTLATSLVAHLEVHRCYVPHIWIPVINACSQ